MKKFFESVNIMGIFMFILCALFGVADCASLMAAGPVISTSAGDGGNPVSPTLTEAPLDIASTRDNAAGLLRPTINELVTKIRPSLFPLDTVMRQAKSRKAHAMVFQWYSSDIRPVEASVKSFTAGSSNGHGFALATIQVSQPGLFAKSDTLLVAGVHGTTNGELNSEDLVLYVCNKNNSAGTLEVITPNGILDESNDMSVPEIAEGTKIYRMSRAAADGDMKTASFAALPVKDTNYCQIFKFCISMSTLQQLSEKEVNWGLTEIEEQGMYEFRMGMEASALFGSKGLIYDMERDSEVYLTGGIVPFIKKHHTLTKGNVTNESLIALCRDVFQGNAGSRKRIMFVGSGMNEVLSSVSTVNKQLEAGNTIVAWGLEWKEIRSNFGTLLLMQHDLLDMYGYEDKAIILDPDFIDKYEFVPLSSTNLDTKKSGEFDGDVKIWTEVAGYALRYPSCHCIVDLEEEA